MAPQGNDCHRQSTHCPSLVREAPLSTASIWMQLRGCYVNTTCHLKGPTRGISFCSSAGVPLAFVHPQVVSRALGARSWCFYARTTTSNAAARLSF